ncbi:MAG: hypothetical protein RLZZ52_1187, partial [Actinomycetota bacterium]
VEAKVIEALDMPVMHDDQHGTAVVVLAALTNAAKIVGRELGSLKVVIAGAGAAGLAVGEMLLAVGIRLTVLISTMPRRALRRALTLVASKAVLPKHLTEQMSLLVSLPPRSTKACWRR